MNTKKLLTKLGRLYPKRIAIKNRDFVGYMAGQKVSEVKRIVLVLDLDEIIVDKVYAHKPDLIITHHPFIYGTRSRVFKKDLKRKEFAEKLDQLPTLVYSMHTNFDEAPNGMNDALAAKLGLTSVAPLLGNPMARGGFLKEELTREEFCKYAVSKLGCEYGLLVDGGSPKIKSVALIGGGGSRSWTSAKEEGYDIYISGDAPHHVRRDILNAKYNYLDVPHEVENVFMEKMKEVLLTIDPTFEIIAITHELPPKAIK